MEMRSADTGLTNALVAFFYGAMLGLALFLGAWMKLPWPWELSQPTWPLPYQLGAGVAVALGVVALTQLCNTYFAWAKALDATMRDALGLLSLPKVLWMALASGIGEEWLFRGAVQPLVATWLGPWGACIMVGLLFGAIHIGSPLRTYLPWTLMAIVMGWILGGLTVLSGSFIAAVVAHILINALNMTMMWRSQQPAPHDAG